MKIQRVFGNIWIGPGDDVKKICRKFMGESDIDLEGIPIHRQAASYAILDVAHDYPEFPHPPEMMFIHAGLGDAPADLSKPYGEDNQITQYINAVYCLRMLLEGPWEVFVHCHEGVSRSSFVVACYLAWKLEVSYAESLVILQQLYPRANPHPKHAKFAEKIIEALEAI